MKLTKQDRRMIAMKILSNMETVYKEEFMNDKTYLKKLTTYKETLLNKFNEYLQAKKAQEQIEKDIRNISGVSYIHSDASNFLERAVNNFNSKQAPKKLPTIEDVEFELFKEENGAKNIDDLMALISVKLAKK